jgi:hypothetical protein
VEERPKKETPKTDTHGSGEKVGIGWWELWVNLIIKKNRKTMRHEYLFEQ